jgi:replicative DNA helicase
MEENIAKKSFGNLRINKPIDSSAQVFGKVPPQARELEEAVMGALLIDNNALSEVIDILKPESFYVDAHHYIFKAIVNLFNKSQPIDLLTVAEELRKNGNLELVGGAFALSELTNKVASSANIEFHARIIIQKFIQRELIKLSTEIIRDAYEDTTDVLDLLDNAEKKIYGVADQNLRKGSDNMLSLVAKALNEISDVRSRPEGLTGVPSGFTKLDRLTSGWQGAELIIIAARPAMGKTAFVLNMARHAAVDCNMGVAIFSLEMGSTQLVKRLISTECEIEQEKIRNGSLSDAEWMILNKKVERLANAPIFINDTAGINIFELRAQCRRLKSAHDIKIVMIDYLQLMSGTSDGKGMNREQEISNISRSLKSLSKELDIPVIALSQLSRAVETRTGEKKPQLSDLRESGAIEQDADLVMGLYRPEYYGFLQDANGQSTQGVSEVIVMKNRHGPTDTIQLKFVSRFGRFEDFDSFGNEFNNFMSNQSGSTNLQSDNYTTLGSKMNEDNANLPDEDPPF